MRTFQKYIKEFISVVVIISISCAFLSYKSNKEQTQNSGTELENKNVIEIITENMDFQMPDTITSGWNTFRYKNLSLQTHFFLVEKYPKGKTSEDAENLVAPIFDSAMKLITEGKTEEGHAEFAKLPEWYSEVVFVGGSGLLSPGQVGETMIYLRPGKYIAECYVKMSNGVFHTSMGMIKDFIVSEIDSDNKELMADINIDVSSTDGIVFNDSISSGKHTFSVYFKDQIVHENFVGHDVNLVKFNNDAKLKDLDNWMNWADPKGLIEPAPSGITFLGGVNDMPEGNIGYFTVVLETGNYALISEVPNSSSKNMLKTFVISD